jgi:hypothetical protein
LARTTHEEDMMSAKTWVWMSLSALLLAIGCDARTLIGQVPDGSAPDGAGGSNQPSFDPVGTSGHTCAPPVFAGDQAYDLPAGTEGVWTGYVDNVSDVSISSDSIRLTLDHATDGTSQIHLVLGVKAPPPAATSATDIYPPGANIGAGGASGQMVEGFSYTAHNVNWQPFGQESRLRFMINIAEPYAGWCQLQSSYAVNYGGGADYSCVPGNGGGTLTGVGADGGTCYASDGSGHMKAVSCAQLRMCAGNYLCGCDQCGCDQQGIAFGGVPSAGYGSYDILFDGTSASGNGVHLMRAAN